MNRLVKYNPAFLDAATRATRYGGRHEDLADLCQILRENLDRQRNQHVVVVGSRGMGKTTLLLRTADVVRTDPQLAPHWLPVIASEETYLAGTLGELWLEMILHLSRATGEAAHERAYERLHAEHAHGARAGADQRLAVAALGYLLDVADRRGKRLILVIENLQMLFGEQLDEKAAWSLREVLIGEERIMLLGSAVSVFAEIEDPAAPLFEQFLLHRLQPLDTDGCLDLWQRATGEKVPRSRMRALEILTGGNPRLLTILADFASRLSLRELTSDLAGVLDEHTDYLKMTTEALPALERRVFVTLAEIWEHASAADVAARARIDSNVASAQLARLVDRGAVVWRRKGRGKQYRVAERLYGLYHLMRRRGGVAARARAATEFMIAYYDSPALVRHVEAIAAEAPTLSPEEQAEHFLVVEGILESRGMARYRGDLVAQLADKLPTHQETPAWLRELLRSRTAASGHGGAGELADRRALPAAATVAALAAAEEALLADLPLKAIAVLEGAVPDAAPAVAACLGQALIELSRQESKAGNWQAALASIARAVSTYERLAEADPDEFRPALALSLINLSNRHGDLGQREEALASIARAVKVYEGLAKARPEGFLPDLAMSLNNLSIRQANLGQREEALASIVRATEIGEHLGKALPEIFLPDLALSLNTRSKREADLGHREAALESIRRAVEIREQLVKARPDEFLPDLATSMSNKSICQAELGQHEEALRSILRAVEIRERLAKAQPASLPDLVRSLNALSIMQANCGRNEEALSSIAQAAAIAEVLAEARPAAFLPDLAMSLNNLSNRQADFGQREEALRSIARATKIHEDLAKARREAFLPDLARSLNNLSIRQAELGQQEQALESIRCAVGTFESLAKAHPDAFLPGLAAALNNLSNYQGDLGQREDALASIARAAEICQGLAEAQPDAFLPDFATSLNNLSVRQAALGKREQALTSIARAVEIRANLAKARPSVFLPELAVSLNNLSVRQGDVGQHEEALVSIVRAVEIREGLARERPEVFLPDLAHSLNNLSKRQLQLGKREEALTSVDRAVVTYRQLAGAKSSLFASRLADALTGRASLLADRGQLAEAEANFAEAVDLDADNLGARAALGVLQARSGRVELATGQLTAVLSDSGRPSDRTRAIIDLAVALAAVGQAAQVRKMIASSDLEDRLEPLIVALGMHMGEEVSAPAEIEEISKDIVAQISEQARGGDNVAAGAD